MESIIVDPTTNPCSEIPIGRGNARQDSFRYIASPMFEEAYFNSQPSPAILITRRDAGSTIFHISPVTPIPMSRPRMSGIWGILSDFQPRSVQTIYEIGNPNPIHFVPGREEEYMTRSELNRMSPRARTIYSIISCLEAYLKHDSMPLEFTITSLRNYLYVLQDSTESEGQRELFNLTLYDNLFGTEDSVLTINMENFKRLCQHCR